MASWEKGKQKDFSGVNQLGQDLGSGHFGRFYVFHGEEIYMRDKMFRELEQAVVPAGVEAFNYHLFQGNEVSLEAFDEAVNSFPMMAAQSFVVVRDWDIFKMVEGNREELLGILQDIPEYCVLVFVFDQVHFNRAVKIGKSIVEIALMVDFPRKDRRDLEQWIQGYFQELGREISSSVAGALIDFCGDFMTELASEIEKIAAYSSGVEVTKDDIYEVASPHLDVKAFEISNALGNQDYDRALGVLSDLHQMKVDPFGILGMLSTQVRRMYGGRICLDSGKGKDYVCELCGISGYQGKYLMESVRNVSLNWCRQACLLCAKTDRRMKLGGDPMELLVQLLLDMSGVR